MDPDCSMCPAAHPCTIGEYTGRCPELPRELDEDDVDCRNCEHVGRRGSTLWCMPGDHAVTDQTFAERCCDWEPREFIPARQGGGLDEHQHWLDEQKALGYQVVLDYANEYGSVVRVSKEGYVTQYLTFPARVAGIFDQAMEAQK